MLVSCRYSSLPGSVTHEIQVVGESKCSHEKVPLKTFRRLGGPIQLTLIFPEAALGLVGDCNFSGT